MTTLTRLEKCLLPPPETVRWNQGNFAIEQCTTVQKSIHYIKNFFTFTGLLLVSPLTLPYDYFTQKQVTNIQRTPNITPPLISWPPEQRGFAMSLFQTSGLGTKWSAAPPLAGKCDWDKWMDKPAHIQHLEGVYGQDIARTHTCTA